MAKAKTATNAFIDFFTPKGKSSGALPSSAKLPDYDTAMSKYLSNERLSAAETTVLGLNHPAGGGVNLSRLPSEYTAEFDMQRKLKPRKIITPESMFGSASIPLVGDSADAGKRLISVNGIPLNEDVNLQGGSRFGRDNKDAWASGQGVVTVLDNQIERALQGVDKVYAPHVSMSGTGGDFNTMTTKTLLNLFDPADISPESAKKFDDSIKSIQKKNKKTGEITYPFADFVGVQHPELREQLLSKLEGTGNLRKAFVETMNKAEFQKLGFPEPAAARFATSDRVLLDKPIGSTGYEIMEFAPGERVITKPKVPHETYPVHLKGNYAGSLADTVPAEVFFKDYYEGRRLMGSPKSSDTRAFTMSSPIQYHDQAWLDNIMGFITARDAKIKTGEYADGGMVESPTQEAIADTVRNPNAARMLEMDLANLAVMNQPQRMAEGGEVSPRLFYEKPKKLPDGVVADTGQADGVYSPTVASETSRVFGMNPKADRLSILPRYSREEGLVAPQFVYDAAKAITAPSVAARGYEVAPDEAVNLAMNVAGAGYGAGAAMRNPTGKGGKDLGMFVGQKSNTWDMDKYEMALKMDKAGIDPSEINRYTGYYKNPSSKVWSQEIPDASAKLVGKMPESLGETVPLGDIIRHENLFYAYPDMKNIPVTREAGAGATYSPERNSISIGTEIVDPITQLKALLHEAQHSIQTKERFPRGTNKGEMEQFITPEMAKINERLGELFYAAKRDPKNEKEWGELNSKMRKLKKQQKEDATETYMRAEGEAQARAVEERMLLSEKQRREIVPTASFDRPMSQLHQLYANGGAVKMAEGGEPSQAEIDRQRLELMNAPVIQATPQTFTQRAIGTLGGYMDQAGEFVSEAIKPLEERNPVKHFLADMFLAGSLKGAGTALQDYTKTSREYTEDNPYKRAPITGSGQTMSLDPRMLDVIGFAQPVAKYGIKGVRAGAKAVTPFAKDVGEMASEMYMRGDVPFMPSPNLYAASPDGKPSKVLAPANQIGFYSPTEAAALNLQRKSGQGQAFLNDIMKGENVKADEISAMGLDTFLKGKTNVTADEVRDYIAQNKIQLGETVYGYRKPPEAKPESPEDFLRFENLGEEIDSSRNFAAETKAPKFERYQLPGGENYREIVLTLPDQPVNALAAYAKYRDELYSKYGKSYYQVEASPEELNKLNLLSEATSVVQPQYRSSHWDEPNALAHLRVSDRVTDGKKTLLVDEVQSDWHQAGRDKGYVDPNAKTSLQLERELNIVEQKRKQLLNEAEALPDSEVEKFNKLMEESRNLTDQARDLYEQFDASVGNRYKVPDAPYKDDWYQLTLRRAIKEAVDGGYDRVALPTGQRVAERFDLSKQIDRIDYNKNDDGTFSMSAIKDGREVFAKEGLDEKELSGIVGKDVAKKIVGDEGSSAPKADRWEAEDGDVPEFKSLSGLDLSVGGEGMKKYYDEIYPSYLKKLGKKYGAQSGMTKVDVEGKPEPLHYMEITPAMRKEFSTGIHMKRGGKVQFAKSLDAMRHELTKAK